MMFATNFRVEEWVWSRVYRPSFKFYCTTCSDEDINIVGIRVGNVQLVIWKGEEKKSKIHLSVNQFVWIQINCQWLKKKKNYSTNDVRCLWCNIPTPFGMKTLWSNNLPVPALDVVVHWSCNNVLHSIPVTLHPGHTPDAVVMCLLLLVHYAILYEWRREYYIEKCIVLCNNKLIFKYHV